RVPGEGGGTSPREAGREASAREPILGQARDGHQRAAGQPRIPGRARSGAQKGLRHRGSRRRGCDRIAGRSARAAAGAPREERHAGEGMTATRVYLVRHGATTLTAEDAFAGETDVPLSDVGRDQLRKLACRLAQEPIAAFYASPLGRTMETARILAEPHGKPITAVSGLREISHGHWEGRTRADVKKEYPVEYARWQEDP